jgi:hypothetical protein
MTTVKEFDELPIRVREDVARARNAHVRMTAAREEMMSYSAALKAHVRILHNKHDLNASRIAALLGLSRTRVLDILGKR